MSLESAMHSAYSSSHPEFLARALLIGGAGGGGLAGAHGRVIHRRRAGDGSGSPVDVVFVQGVEADRCVRALVEDGEVREQEDRVGALLGEVFLVVGGQV